MRMKCCLRSFLTGCLTLATGACVAPAPARAQSARVDAIPTPESVIGHEVGADYKLARWETIVAYFNRLDTASERVRVRQVDVGTEGSPYIIAVIAAPETIRDLDKYKALQRQLADPRTMPPDRRDDKAYRAELLADAKTTIVVTFGLHSSECAGSQTSMELAYDLATGDDARTLEMLEHCVIVLVPSANPDGNNKIVDWYERNLDTPYEGGRMPWLYQKYAGHDNNRDWFMLNLKESRILTELLYTEWFPTILYDVHQMGNRGARFFVPPFFDPVNPNVDPLIHQSLLIIGGHMATELQERGKTGVIFKAIFDNWWAGGNRTTPYRHNIVGILSEAASAKMASPIFQDYRDFRAGGRGFPQYAPAVNFPEPWPGGWWRLRDVVEYQKISCVSLFTLAARYRDRFVRNHLALSEKALRLGREEPPFAWIVPEAQRDPGSAAHMLEVLRLTGVEVHRAERAFTADKREYPAGTHILFAEQPFRPHLKDMMERQGYPDRRQYAGGPAESPYDAAGWTLPLQMGVKSVEVVAPFEAETKLLTAKITASGRAPSAEASPAGVVTRRFGNADFAAVNQLMREGYPVEVLVDKHEGLPQGTLLVGDHSSKRSAVSRVSELVKAIPARFEALPSRPSERELRTMSKPRTALYQPWTGNMDEGWTRLVLEQFDFDYTSIHNAEVRAGDLHDRFDCIIMPDQRLSRIVSGISDKFMPPPYAGGIGKDGAMALERFVEDGGTLVLMDSATSLATELLAVPVRDALKDLPRERFFCPGSLLRIRVDNTHPLGYGFGREATANFSRSQAFVIGEAALEPATHASGAQGGGSRSTGAFAPRHGGYPGGHRAGPPSAARSRGDHAPGPRTLTKEEIRAKLDAQPVASVARYSDNIVLQSGWILGEDHLRGRTAVAEVTHGKGRIVLLGFRTQFRGQPHGTFKFLFNAIYRSAMED